MCHAGPYKPTTFMHKSVIISFGLEANRNEKYLLKTTLLNETNICFLLANHINGIKWRIYKNN